MILLLITLLALALFSLYLYFGENSKMPRKCYDLKMALGFQYIGISGVIHDFIYKSRDQVALYKQTGLVAVITGGNRGIGLRVVEKLLACDITVVMGVRDPIGAEAAVGSLIDLKASGGKLICEKLDIGDLTSVKEFAQKVKARYNKIDLLLNNAGIMLTPFKLTVDGYESQFAINYLGHFLLTHLLLPELKAAGKEGKNSRIVNDIDYDDINGLKYYNPNTAYGQSKLAQVLAANHLQTILDAHSAHVQVISIHPGIVNTDLFEHSVNNAQWFKNTFFKTPERGSRTVVFAAIDPSIEGKGGIYLSNCGPGKTHPDVKNPAKCEKFFKYSCELLKIENYGSGRV